MQCTAFSKVTTVIEMAQPATIVDFETSVGTFSVELYAQHAPRTCFNFAELAKIGEFSQDVSTDTLEIEDNQHE